jgi:glycolate oxidase iron-sulfur subunit
VLQPGIADALRERKIGHLEQLDPVVVTSANVGCIGHLQAGTERPVMHWIEWIDDGLAAAAGWTP